MVTKFKLINENEKVGVWINEITFLKVVKICKYRNDKLYLDLIDKYEKLTNKKFDETVLNNI